jgi:hypothetical protein
MLKAIPKGKAIRLTQRLTIATLTGVCLFLCLPEARKTGVFKLIGSQPATAQIFSSQDSWRQVYQRLPNFPLENQYVSNETGNVDSDSTLASRLIRYHIFVKSRPPNYRLDWKLTLADYLGAHEYLVESQYPGGNTLRQNPMEGDRAAIEKLSRAQRDALIDVLVSIFNPNPSGTPAPAPSASPPPPTTPNPRATPSLPKPGDAQLLLP